MASEPQNGANSNDRCDTENTKRISIGVSRYFLILFSKEYTPISNRGGDERRVRSGLYRRRAVATDINREIKRRITGIKQLPRRVSYSCLRDVPLHSYLFPIASFLDSIRRILWSTCVARDMERECQRWKCVKIRKKYL